MSSWTEVVTSPREIDEISGCSRGKITSLSISTNEAADGGGIGEMLRRIPEASTWSDLAFSAFWALFDGLGNSVWATDKRHATWLASARSSETAGALSSVRT